MKTLAPFFPHNLFRYLRTVADPLFLFLWLQWLPSCFPTHTTYSRPQPPHCLPLISNTICLLESCWRGKELRPSLQWIIQNEDYSITGIRTSSLSLLGWHRWANRTGSQRSGAGSLRAGRWKERGRQQRDPAGRGGLAEQRSSAAPRARRAAAGRAEPAEPGRGAALPPRGALLRLLPTPAAASLTLSPSMAGRHVPPYATGRLPEGTKARWPRPGLPSNGRRARTRLGSAARGCGNGNGSVERGGSAVCAPGPWRRREAFLPELGFLRRSEGQGRGRLCTAPRCSVRCWPSIGWEPWNRS